MKVDVVKLQTQIQVVKEALKPEAEMYIGLCEFCALIDLFFKYLESHEMDKKMHQITKRITAAEKDIKKGKDEQAAKVLKKAASKNEKLVKEDREVRDPMIKKCKKEMKMKGKK